MDTERTAPDRPLRTGDPPGAPAAQLCLAFHADHPLAPAAAHPLARPGAVVIGRGEACALELAADGMRQLVLRLPDERMSARHARLLRVLDGWVLEDTGSTNGTFVNNAPTTRHLLADGDVIGMGH